MAQRSEIERLGDRRRLLLAESEHLRRQLAMEVGQLQAATVWVETGYSFVQSVRAYWPLVAAAAGFLIARKRSSLLSSLGKIWSVWRMTKRLVPLWRQFFTKSSLSSSAQET